MTPHRHYTDAELIRYETARELIGFEIARNVTLLTNEMSTEEKSPQQRKLWHELNALMLQQQSLPINDQAALDAIITVYEAKLRKHA